VKDEYQQSAENVIAKIKAYLQGQSDQE